jgi:hypothetical protein
MSGTRGVGDQPTLSEDAGVTPRPTDDPNGGTGPEDAPGSTNPDTGEDDLNEVRVDGEPEENEWMEEDGESVRGTPPPPNVSEMNPLGHTGPESTNVLPGDGEYGRNNENGAPEENGPVGGEDEDACGEITYHIIPHPNPPAGNPPVSSPIPGIGNAPPEYSPGAHTDGADPMHVEGEEGDEDEGDEDEETSGDADEEEPQQPQQIGGSIDMEIFNDEMHSSRGLLCDSNHLKYEMAVPRWSDDPIAVFYAAVDRRQLDGHRAQMTDQQINEHYAKGAAEVFECPVSVVVEAYEVDDIRCAGVYMRPSKINPRVRRVAAEELIKWPGEIYPRCVVGVPLPTSKRSTEQSEVFIEAASTAGRRDLRGRRNEIMSAMRHVVEQGLSADEGRYNPVTLEKDSGVPALVAYWTWKSHRIHGLGNQFSENLCYDYWAYQIEDNPLVRSHQGSWIRPQLKNNAALPEQFNMAYPATMSSTVRESLKQVAEPLQTSADRYTARVYDSTFSNASDEMLKSARGLHTRRFGPEAVALRVVSIAEEPLWADPAAACEHLRDQALIPILGVKSVRQTLHTPTGTCAIAVVKLVVWEQDKEKAKAAVAATPQTVARLWQCDPGDFRHSLGTDYFIDSTGEPCVDRPRNTASERLNSAVGMVDSAHDSQITVAAEDAATSMRVRRAMEELAQAKEEAQLREIKAMTQQVRAQAAQSDVQTELRIKVELQENNDTRGARTGKGVWEVKVRPAWKSPNDLLQYMAQNRFPANMGIADVTLATFRGALDHRGVQVRAEVYIGTSNRPATARQLDQSNLVDIAEDRDKIHVACYPPTGGPEDHTEGALPSWAKAWVEDKRRYQHEAAHGLQNYGADASVIPNPFPRNPAAGPQPAANTAANTTADSPAPAEYDSLHRLERRARGFMEDGGSQGRGDVRATPEHPDQTDREAVRRRMDDVDL